MFFVVSRLSSASHEVGTVEVGSAGDDHSGQGWWWWRWVYVGALFWRAHLQKEKWFGLSVSIFYVVKPGSLVAIIWTRQEMLLRYVPLDKRACGPWTSNFWKWLKSQAVWNTMKRVRNGHAKKTAACMIDLKGQSTRLLHQANWYLEEFWMVAGC